MKAAGLLAEIGFHFGRRVEDRLDLLVEKIIDGDEVPPAQAHGSLSRSPADIERPASWRPLVIRDLWYHAGGGRIKARKINR